jgi:hypothetical protein
MMAENAMKTKIPILLQSIVLALLWFAAISCSNSESSGMIRGFVLVPDEIDLSTAPKEAELYIPLNNSIYPLI